LWPPLDLLQQVHVLPVLGAPELDAGLQVESQKSRAEGQNPLPRSAGHAAFDAAQELYLPAEVKVMAAVRGTEGGISTAVVLIG